MNIKQAKEEIKHTVQAYLAKDEFGGYRIPAIRQRPMLLIGPPGIGKTQIMNRSQQSADRACCIHNHTPHKAECRAGFRLSGRRI